MCIISGPVTNVNGTKIFVLPSRDGRRQLTVYRNAINTPVENVMCLPVPNIRSVKLEKVYDSLFDDCSLSFEQGRGKGFFGMSQGMLAILEHDSYRVVVVPSMDDLERVPAEIAILSSGAKEFLRSNYKEAGWGVLLCKLKPGATDYSPFAYSHDRLASGNLFVPTMHYHNHIFVPVLNGGSVDKDVFYASLGRTLSSFPAEGAAPLVYNPTVFDAERTSTASFVRLTSEPSETPVPSAPSKLLSSAILASSVGEIRTDHADWDHEIFSCFTPPSSHKNPALHPSPQNQIDWSQMPADFAVGKDVSLHCLARVGDHYPNEDIQLPCLVALPAPSVMTSIRSWVGL